MAIGERAYQAAVPAEARRLADETGVGRPNWFIPGAEASPYLPETVRRLLEMTDEILRSAGLVD
jgi:hypothetical protein